MFITVLQIAGMAVVEINQLIYIHTQKNLTMLSLVTLALYTLVIRCYQIAQRAILTNTNKRQAQEMALEGMLE